MDFEHEPEPHDSASAPRPAQELMLSGSSDLSPAAAGADVAAVTRIAAAAAKVAELTAEVHNLTAAAAPAGEPGTDLVAVQPNLAPEQVKAALAQTRAQAVRKQDELVRAQRELKDALDAQLAQAHRAMEPLQKMVKRLEEGIFAVQLYLGRDEEILTLSDGTPAPADTPVMVRQLVLSMDQECMVAAETGGMDATSVEAFDEWLLADPAHLDQVLPEQRGVVVLVPRRTPANYGDPWLQKTMDEANKRSYWLMRNGQRLYRMTTDLNVGDRLVPTSDEFTKFFVEARYDHTAGESQRVALQPGTTAWLKAEEAADARRRHYMRVALVLQGLLARTTVFAPLPSADVSFLDPESYEAGWVRIIADAENALGTGRQPFRQWLADRCAKLRPGMRIVGAFDGREFADLREQHRHGHERLTPPAASYPVTGELYQIRDRRSDGALTFSYTRTDKVWDDYEGYRAPKTKASCVLYPDDRFVIPFDLVTVDEMCAYLESRSERHEYLTMLPLLRAAIAAKRDEEQIEAPFRLMLAGQMATANGVTVAQAQDAVDELVEWWKVTNRWHRPLVADEQEAQAKAVTMIVAEHAARLKATAAAAGQATDEARILTALRDEFSDAVAVFRKRDGSYVVYRPADDEDVFVHRVTLSATGRSRQTTEWLLTGGWRAWRLLWSADRWAGWNHEATQAAHLTGPELTEIIDALAADCVDSPVRWEGQALVAAHNSDSRKVTLYRRASQPVSKPQPALTGGFPTDEVTYRQAWWRRTTGGRLVVDYGRPDRTEWHWFSDSWLEQFSVPWPGKVVDGRWTRPAPRAGERMVWADEAAVAAAVDEHIAGSALHQNQRKGFDRARAVTRMVEVAWTADREAAEYERFLADYQAPDLWEGHRKTLRFTYPHHHDPALWRLACRSVESDLPVSGLTVAQAAARFAGEEFAIPEDMLKLRFNEPDTAA